MDGEEGMLHADVIFENLNRYILVIDLVKDLLIDTLTKIRDKKSLSSQFFLDESFLNE